MRKLEFSLASAHKRYYRTERSGDGVAWNSVPYNMIVEQVMDLLLSFLHKENSDSESRHAKNNPTGHMLNIPRMIFFSHNAEFVQKRHFARGSVGTNKTSPCSCLLIVQRYRGRRLPSELREL
jgi:hypothetical protein